MHTLNIFLIKCVDNLVFYNYSYILQLPNFGSITTNFKQNVSYRIVKLFGLPTQNTINLFIQSCSFGDLIKVVVYFILIV